MTINVGRDEFAETPFLAVDIRPLEHNENLLTLARCREILQTNAVALRGWDFPHVDRNEPLNGPGYVFGATNFAGHIEEWRFHTTGQFLFKGHLWEAVDQTYQSTLAKEADFSIKPFSGARWAQVRGFTSFVGLIYHCTEVMTLASRLAQAVPYGDSTRVRIVLNNVLKYVLASGEPGVSLHSLYMSAMPSITYSDDFASAVLVANPSAAARIAARRIFEGYNWNNPAEDMMVQWQQRIGA